MIVALSQIGAWLDSPPHWLDVAPAVPVLAWRHVEQGFDEQPTGLL